MTKKIKYIFIREQIIKSVREFFTKRGFREVVIPVFSTSLPLEQNIYPFQTTWDNLKGKKDFYLTTSPEAYLKKMIAKGMGNCFAIGHSFRNMESAGILHNPEFLMLEWYREGADYTKIMDECRELIMFIFLSLRGVKRRGNLSTHLRGRWPIFSMEDLFKKYAKLDLEQFCHSGLDPESKRIPHQVRDDILSKITERGYTTQNATWEQIFNQIFLNEIEPQLPKNPFFLIDYPAKISPLCAKRKDKPYLAERFELYISGVEIGNGNTENTDAQDVLKQFKNEEIRRKKLGILSPPIDMEFIRALKKMQGKKYAGIGLGVERLAMVLGEIEDIGGLELSSRT